MNLPCTLLAAAAMSALALAGESPLVGKPAPELLLADHMIQGESFTQGDFAGKVVFLDFYQRGCPRCEANSMPHLQRLHEKYRDNPSVMIVAVNTAFEKEQYPWMADEDGTRQHCKSEGWEMPVARDLDERSVRVYGMGGSYGTPMGVVIDAGGTVVEHRWNSTEEDSAALERAFEAALAELDSSFVPKPREVTPALRPVAAAIEAGRYGTAFKLASKAQESSRASAEDQTDAAYLIELITSTLARQRRDAEETFAIDPPAGIDRAKEVAKLFKGVEGAGEVDELWRAWKDDPAVAAFEALAGELRELEKRARKLGRRASEEERTALRSELEQLAVRAGETRLAGEARALAGGIE